MSIDVREIYKNWSIIFTDNKDRLIELDSVAGDGDLGLVMYDGFTALYKDVLANPEEDLGKLFYRTGKLFNNVASSSMGTLISVGLMTVGKKLKGKKELEKEDLILILEGIAEGVQNIGKAQEGEKTFLDAIFPALRAAKENVDKSAKEMMQEAVKAAEKGVENAKNMVAKHGRIAFRQEASVGIVDPGTVAALLIVEGIEKTIE